MTVFDDLTFKPVEGSIGNHIQATTFFPNGYGASVVRASFTYGGDEGKYELAVVKGTADKWRICYDTPITDDVIGWLKPSEVTSLLSEIEELEPSQ